MSADGRSDEELRAILSSNPTIAVLGASPKPERPSHGVMSYLLRHGYHVIPVNPGHGGGTILGQTVYARLADVPEPIDIVDVFRRTAKLGEAVDEALALDPKPRVVWMQLGLEDQAAAKKAEAAGITVVMDRCIKIEHARLQDAIA